ALQLLALLAIRDVAGNLGSSYDAPRSVAQRRYRQREVHSSPVLGQPLGVEVFDTLAAPHLRDDRLLLMKQLLGYDPGHRLTDHLVSSITQDARRPGVPGCDDPAQGLADDYVVGG